MALGEWLSVQSSRELYQHQLGIEKYELETIPEEEKEELALIYQAKGIAPKRRAIWPIVCCQTTPPPWIRWRERSWPSIHRSWAARPGKLP